MFSLKGFRRIIVGEKMPDKNDPKYKERYEREVNAGRRFAQITGLAWLQERLYKWAEAHKKAFFAIMLGLMTFFAVANIARLCSVTNVKVAAMHKAHSVKQDSIKSITDYVKENKR
jgi:hypothetical protein